MRRTLSLLALLAATLLAAPSSEAKTRDVWVAAVNVNFNAMPTGRDLITGQAYTTSETVFPTVIYRRTTKDWRAPLRNSSEATAPRDEIPGPLVRARVGDRIRVHFKNLDYAYRRSHSMHFHGVRYRPSSDGSFVPGVSGPDGDVKPGASWTYRLHAVRTSAGVWPYHDHSRSMHESIEGGMYGALSILGRRERRADREFVVFFNSTHDFETINNRAFVENTPVFRSRAGELVQWDVLAMGSAHHTFHVHGHRWRGFDEVPADTRTLGPAESFRVRWRESEPGVWLYHCHREDHMERGMIGLYRVAPARRRGQAAAG